MTGFRVALSGDFKGQDGAFTFPEFDLSPLTATPGLEMLFLEPQEVIASEQLRDVDALILLSNRIEEESFPGDGRLSVIARFGVGYDSVDVAACTANDCALVIVPDGVRRPVAVTILTLLFALAGNLIVKDRIARLGPEGWSQKTRYNGIGLVGRTLGSIGIGNIGAEMFRLAAPLDMKFLAHDPFVPPDLAHELDVELVDLETVFRRSDFLAVNCPLSDETRHLVNADRLALMKPSAYLINTARGPIVDQAALTSVLQEGRIAGAGLDVLDQEPPDADDPILQADNAIITPHALCFTDQLFAGSGAADVRAVLAVMAGEVPTGIVNREVVDRPGWRKRLRDYAERFAKT